MAIQTRALEYADGDVVLEGVLAWDDALEGPRPAVAVSHTWAGRSPFEEGKALELAEQGYVGFALDMYGKGVRGSSPEENTALMTPLLQDRPLLQRRINAAISTLRQQAEVDPAKVAATGYCFGGLCVLDLARSGSDVCGVVSLHGLFAAPDAAPAVQIRARVLCLHGYDDPMVPPQSMLELASELSAAGADWQVHAYGNTVHAFTNPAADSPEMGAVYSPIADSRSSLAVRNFLVECFA
jgi:dienelactone hydrolase